jgi:hypothetical protein
MRDAGALKGASRSRRGVVGVLLLVGVVVAAAALLGPSDASDDDASTSSGVTLAKGAAAWARATLPRPDATSTGGVSGRSSDIKVSESDAVNSLVSTRCVADPAHAPKMTEREMATVLKYVSGSFVGATWRDGEARYLEWGGGGSTSVFGTRRALGAHRGAQQGVVPGDIGVARDAMHGKKTKVETLLPRRKRGFKKVGVPG